VVVAPTVQRTTVPTPVVSSPNVAANENEDSIPHAQPEPVAADEGEQQQPPGPEIPVAMAPQRPQRTRRSAISDDYEVYNSKEIQIEGDPTSFEEAMKNTNSSKWFAAMEDKMKSMSTNKVWDLKEILKGAKTVGCKWVYKTKCDSKGNIERYKARLVAKGFTQRE